MLYIVKSNSSWVFAYITLWKMVENGTSKYCKTNHNFASLKCDLLNIQHFCEYTTSWDTRTAFCFLEIVGSMHEMPQYSNFYSFRCFEPWIRFLSEFRPTKSHLHLNNIHMFMFCVTKCELFQNIFSILYNCNVRYEFILYVNTQPITRQ